MTIRACRPSALDLEPEPDAKPRLTLDGMRHAFLAIRQRIHERPTHPDSLRPETQRLDDVGPATNSAVDIHLALAALEDLGVKLVDLEQGIQRWRGSTTRQRQYKGLQEDFRPRPTHPALAHRDYSGRSPRSPYRTPAWRPTEFDISVYSRTCSLYNASHLDGLDPLQSDRQLSVSTQPRNVAPVQLWVDEPADRTTDPAAFVVRLNLASRDARGLQVVSCQFGSQSPIYTDGLSTHHLDLGLSPLVRLSFPRSSRIDRDKDPLEPFQTFDLANKGLGLFPLPVDIELHEKGLIGLGTCVDDGVESGRGVGRDLPVRRRLVSLRLSRRAFMIVRTNWMMPCSPATLENAASPSG